MIKVIGVDISLNNIGICNAEITDGIVMVKSVSLIQPDKADAQTKKQVRKNSDDLRRSRWLHDNLQDSIKDCHIITVEMPVGSQSAAAMKSYGICLGVLASVQKPMIEVTPYDVKLAATGIRTATKHEMIEWGVAKHTEIKWKTMKRGGKLVMTNDNEHIADALATIYAGMKTTEFKALMVMMSAIRDAA